MGQRKWWNEVGPYGDGGHVSPYNGLLWDLNLFIKHNYDCKYFFLLLKIVKLL